MERWSSRMGFMLAAVGAAVGLGNVWRFPAVVGRYGGGAYLLPYLLATFGVAVPLFVLELSVGRSHRADVVSAFRTLGGRFVPFGWLLVGTVLLVASYYLVLVGWVLAFLLATATGADLTFSSLTGGYQSVPYFLVAATATGAVVGGGVRTGIERVSRVAMPVVVVLLVALAGYGATLPGFVDGVEFFLAPDRSVLNDPLVWSAAIGQAFFSLSVGTGVMLTYGSYLDREVDLVRSTLVVTVADVSVALLAGLVIFPVVFTFGLEPTLGTELAFSTLPRAFAAMPGGRIVALAFFGLLFLAGLTSAVSLLEVAVAAVVRAVDPTPSRRSASGALTAGLLALGLPSALSYTAAEWRIGGARVLDLVDESVGTVGLLLAAMLVAGLFTRYGDHERLRDDLGDAVFLTAKYVIPVVLAVVTAMRLLTGVDISG